MLPLAADYRSRWMRLHDWPEIVSLHQWAEAAKVILELGVCEGHSTAAFLSAAERSGGQVWSVDIDPPEVPPEWHNLGFWHFRRGNDLDPEVRAWCPPSVDLLFIDTSHLYAQTLAELRVYVPRVNAGGLVVCDDTRRPGVKRALEEFAPGGWENWDTPHGMGLIRR